MSDASKSWPAMSRERAEALLTMPGTPFEFEEVVIRGVPTQVWKNAPPTLRDVFAFARETWGPREFIVNGEEHVTYEAFARAAVILARDLVANGVKKGDRVAIAMRNLPNGRSPSSPRPWRAPSPRR